MLFTIDYQGTLSLVREKVIPRIVDQYFKGHPLLMRMRKKIEFIDGGSFIRQPLSFAPQGGGGQWFKGADRFDTRVRSPFDSAVFFAKNFEVPIVLTQDDEDEVDGPEAFTKLLQAKSTIAMKEIEDGIGGSGGLYNDGSNPKAITGLKFALPAFTGAAPGVPPTQAYAGISASSTVNTWWNHQGNNTVFNTGPSGTGDYIQGTNFGVVDNMLAAQRLASGKSCTMILCNWGVFNDISALVNSRTTWFRPQVDSELAEAGHENFIYRKRRFVVDEYCPRGTTADRIESVFFLDENAMHFWVHRKRNFSTSDWRVAYDQAARVMYIWFRGEIGFDERRSSGVHNNVYTSATSP